MRRGGYYGADASLCGAGSSVSRLRVNISAWRHGRVERGFSMALNRVNDPADPSSVLVSAHDEAGQMVALLSFVPWGPTGLSLDVMSLSLRHLMVWWSLWWRR